MVARRWLNARRDHSRYRAVDRFDRSGVSGVQSIRHQFAELMAVTGFANLSFG